MASATIKNIEDLLATKLTALVDTATPPVPLFVTVDSLTDKDYRVGDVAPSAYTAMIESVSTETRSRLILVDTYQVLVIAQKAETDSARTAYALCEAVRDAVHGKDWNEPAISAFEFAGMRLIDSEGSRLIYAVDFRVTRYLQVPTRT